MSNSLRIKSRELNIHRHGTDFVRSWPKSILDELAAQVLSMNNKNYVNKIASDFN